MDRRSILIFRNGSIGNTLMAVPAINSIRTSFPKAQISVVVDKIGFELLEHCPYIDTLIIYDKRGRDRGFSRFANIARTLRSLNPDCAVLFKRFFRSGLLAYLSGAETRAGFSTDGKAPFLNLTLPYDNAIHVVDLNLRLAALIGADTISADDPVVFLSDEDMIGAARLLKQHGVDESEYVVVHYGGSTSGASHVSPQLLAELLSQLCHKRTLLFVGAGDAECAAAKALAKMLPHAHDLTNLPLRTMIALTKTAYGFVGMNSGPTHIAAACGVPGLALFRDDANFTIESVKWAPRSKLMRVVPIAINVNTESRAIVLASAQRAWCDVTSLRNSS